MSIFGFGCVYIYPSHYHCSTISQPRPAPHSYLTSIAKVNRPLYVTSSTHKPVLVQLCPPPCIKVAPPYCSHHPTLLDPWLQYDYNLANDALHCMWSSDQSLYSKCTVLKKCEREPPSPRSHKSACAVHSLQGRHKSGGWSTYCSFMCTYHTGMISHTPAFINTSWEAFCIAHSVLVLNPFPWVSHVCSLCLESGINSFKPKLGQFCQLNSLQYCKTKEANSKFQLAWISERIC